MKKILYLIYFWVLTYAEYTIAQGIYISPAHVKSGGYKKIVVDTFGVFNSNNRFVLKVKSSVTFSNDSLPNSPQFTNVFINESYFECTNNLAFCYQAPYSKSFPIKGDKRTIWKDTTTYEVYSTSPYRITNLLPIVSSSGDSLSFCSIPFGCKRDTVKIDTLSENFNLVSYQVPRESSVHHYFKIRDKNKKPVKGVVVKYKLSNSSLIYNSSTSDSLGLIDLAIKVGGNNINESSDDIIPVGTTKTAFFFKVFSENGEAVIDTNYFSAFSISVIDKAIPNEKEFGMGITFEAGVEAVIGGELKLGPINFKEGLARIGVGYTYSPSITIIPDKMNSNLWTTKIASPIGIKLSGSLGPKFETTVAKVGVSGGVSADFELKGSNIDESTYKLNMSNASDGFFLGSQIFLLGAKLNPELLLMANFLQRLSNFTPLFESERAGMVIGVEESLNTEAQFNVFKVVSKKTDEGEKEHEFGIGFSAKADINTNYEFSVETTKNDEIYYSTNVSASQSLNLGADIGLPDDLVEIETKTPYTIFENQETFSINAKSHFNSQNQYVDGKITFSNEISKTINNEEYKINYNNDLNYSRKAISLIGTQPNNFVSEFLKQGNTSRSVISISANVNAGINAVNQIINYNKKAFEKPKDTFTSNDFSISNNRDITFKSENSISFSLSAFLGINFELGYNSWNKYNHFLKEYKYTNDFNRMLVVTDYPEIETNLQLPSTSPLTTFLSTLKTGIESSASTAINSAKEFVTEFSGVVSNIATVFSNNQQGNVQRLSLDAKEIKIIPEKKTNTVNTTPSTFTFTIPSNNQSFNTGTNLFFKYYYPENQLEATTASDTFRLITDTFFLSAIASNNTLNTAPNGPFLVNSQFSNYDLELAGLPTNLTPQVLFLPNESQVWEVIGATNQSINFNRLGVFAIGVSLQKDYVPPTITVNPPISFVNGQSFSIALSDDASGIDWSQTYFLCNGKIIPYQRTGTSNVFNIDIALLHNNPIQLPETFAIQIRTKDLSGNRKLFSQTYPCTKSYQFNAILGNLSQTPNIKQASQTIEISGSAATKPPLEIKAGKNIILNPGFEVKPINGEYFKANIGGCN